MTAFVKALGIAATSNLLAFTLAVADPCAQPSPGTPVVSGVGELDIHGSSNIDAGTIGQAIADWQTCSQYGSGFPRLVPNGTAGFPVTLNYHAGVSTQRSGKCGQTVMMYQSGKIVSATIDIWSQQGNGATCSPTYDNLAHELGHVLGQNDAPAGCNGHIMGAPVLQGSPRKVYPSDCTDADSLWKTPTELTPPPPPPPPPPTTCNCPNGCNSSGVCLPVDCSTNPSAPQCQQCDENPTAPGCGDGGGGGGGLDPCDPDDPCDDVITRPNTSPPPPPACLRHHAFVIASVLRAERCSANS